MHLRTIIVWSSLFLLNQYAYAMQETKQLATPKGMIVQVYIDEFMNMRADASCAGILQTPQDLTMHLRTLADWAALHGVSIVSLDVSGNKLNELPDILKKFSLLSSLNCSNNSFTEIPRVVEELDWLETINFSGNKIKNLWDFRSLMPALRTLDLSKNPIEYTSLALSLRSKLSIIQ